MTWFSESIMLVRHVAAVPFAVCAESGHELAAELYEGGRYEAGARAARRAERWGRAADWLLGEARQAAPGTPPPVPPPPPTPPPPAGETPVRRVVVIATGRVAGIGPGRAQDRLN